MSYTFKKRFTDDQGSYEIVYVNLISGRMKAVNEDKPLYRAWLAEENVPEEIPYVAPVDKRTAREKQWAYIRKNINWYTMIEGLVKKIETGSSPKYDELKQCIIDSKVLFPGP